MVEGSADSRVGKFASRPDGAGSPSPAETAALLREVAAVLEASSAGAPPTALQQWPDRLRTSALALCLASLQIEAALLDDDRFARLTNPSFSDEEALGPMREFNVLLETALQALIDLTGYDNPDQEYPDLASWFQFRCPNVVYGRHTDTVHVEGLGADRPPST